MWSQIAETCWWHKVLPQSFWSLHVFLFVYVNLSPDRVCLLWTHRQLVICVNTPTRFDTFVLTRFGLNKAEWIGNAAAYSSERDLFKTARVPFWLLAIFYKWMKWSIWSKNTYIINSWKWNTFRPFSPIRSLSISFYVLFSLFGILYIVFSPHYLTLT